MFMANNSRYYKDKYKKAKNEEWQLGNDIKDLENIIKKLDRLPDEIRAVNNELRQLDEDLKDAVRHNSAFSRARRDATDNTEKDARRDSNLGVVYSEVEDEIRRLKNKKDQAARDKARYKQKYDQKKKEEMEQLWDSIF